MSTTLAETGEIALVARIRDRLGAPADLVVGPGDDAAVRAGCARLQVLTVDRQREGAHFERHWIGPEALGRRAVAVAASDVGAMGARPRWCLSALELPGDLPVAWLDDLVGGLGAAGTELGCPVIGGDVATATTIGIVITVGGDLADGTRPVRRDGARDGDGCWILGDLGRAAAGRAYLDRGAPHDAGHALHCVDAYRAPRPPLRLAARLADESLVGAMMDVSDGLAMDLQRICSSSGVGVRLEAGAWADATVVAAAADLGLDADELVLAGGDDYALLCAVPAAMEAALADAAAEASIRARRIGAFVGPEEGMRWSVAGTETDLPHGGWDPFRQAGR